MAFKKLTDKLFAVLLLAVITSATDLSVKSDIFAKAVYKHLSEEGKNSVFSPLSLHVVLALAYQGSSGHTEQILRKYFLSKSSTSNDYQVLLKDLKTAKNLSMEIANKIYASNDGQFKKEFENIAKDKFLAEVDSVDFRQNQLAANKINDWVKEKTHDKIKKLVSADDFGDDTRSVLLNAIYFKEEWESKFNKNRTRTEKFYLDDTHTVNCPMMYRYGSTSMTKSRDLDATLLRLKFRNRRFNLIIVIPKTKTGIRRLEEKLPTTDFAALTRNMWSGLSEVYLPRFKIESEYDFEKPFEQMGLEEIYSNQANFSEIIEKENLKVSKIIQKATIEINEEGGEASGTSAVIGVEKIGDHPPPPVFRADRPFMYLLTYDLEESTIPFYRSKFVVVFMGKVAKPEIVN